MGVIGPAVVALLFPGQGSQFVGMGRDLAETFPQARDTFEEADDALGFPLSRLCFEGPEDALTLTSNAQPAILTHSVAVQRVVGERLGEVAYTAGHSLGEFTAHVGAGSLGFADALRTVRCRGELMESSGRERPGTMAALLGLDDATAEEVCSRASQQGAVCVPANFNAPGQIVISGDVAAVERAMELAREAGARRALRLNVSGAFHSPLMKVAEAGLAAQLSAVAFVVPACPIISNVTGQPVSDPVEATRLLVRQLTSPVRWTTCVRTLLDAGVQRFIELGPGSVLTSLLKRIERTADARTLGTTPELESLAV